MRGPDRAARTANPVNGSLVTATSYTVPGLTNGTTYYFRVIAVNAAGQGPLSAEAPATLLRIMPTSPPPTYPDVGHHHAVRDPADLARHHSPEGHRADRADRDRR